MHVLSAIMFITALFDIVFAIFIFLKSLNTDKNVSKMYLVTFLMVGAWELIMWLSFFTRFSDSVNYIIDGSAYAFGMIALYGMLLLVWTLTQRNGISKLWIFGIGAIVITFSLMCYVPGLIIGERIYYSDLLFDHYKTGGPVMPYFYVALIGIFAVIAYTFRKGVRLEQRQVQRKRLQIVGWSIMVALVFNIFSSVVLPYYLKFIIHSEIATTTGWFVFQQCLSVVLLSIVSVVVGYAITRYRFMGLRIELKQDAAYGAALAFVFIGLFGIGVFAVQFVGVIIAFGFVLSLSFLYFQFLDRYMRFMLDSVFFLNRLDPSKAFTYDERKFDSYKAVRPWIDMICSQLAQLDARCMGLYLLQRQHNRLTDPRTGKHLWLELPYMKEILAKGSGVYGPADFQEHLQKKLQRSSFIVVAVDKGKVQGVLLIQAPDASMDQLIAVTDKFIKRAKQQVDYYESVEGAKRTVKELIYKED